MDYTEPEYLPISFAEVGFVASNRTRNQSQVRLLSEAQLLAPQQSAYFEFVLNSIVVPILFTLINITKTILYSQC